MISATEKLRILRITAVPAVISPLHSMVAEVKIPPRASIPVPALPISRMTETDIQVLKTTATRTAITDRAPITVLIMTLQIIITAISAAPVLMKMLCILWASAELPR